MAVCWRFLILSLVTLGGCANLDPAVRLDSVNIALDQDANLKSATAVDVVVIYKKSLLDAMMGMQAADYFASTDQIKRDYPEMVDIWHWELTPGQVVKNYPIKQRSDDPVGVFVFADYLTPGNHRVRLGSSDVVHIRLKATDFCVLEQGCSFEHTGADRAQISKEAASIRNQLTRHQPIQNRGSDRSVTLNTNASDRDQRDSPGLQAIEKVTESAQKVARLFK